MSYFFYTVITLTVCGGWIRCYEITNIEGRNPCTELQRVSAEECRSELPAYYTHQVDNNNVIVKGCKGKVSQNFCMEFEQKMKNDVYIHCTMCDEHGCSRTALTTPSVALFMLLTVIYFLFV